MQRTLRLSLLAAVVAAAPFLAACGDDDTTGSSSETTSGGAASSSLEVHGTDQLKFDKTAYEAEAGRIDIAYINDGGTAHTLLIKDVEDFKLEMGSRDEGSVELEAGEYTLYCDVAGHESAGMVATLTVS